MTENDSAAPGGVPDLPDDARRAAVHGVAAALCEQEEHAESGDAWWGKSTDEVAELVAEAALAAALPSIRRHDASRIDALAESHPGAVETAGEFSYNRGVYNGFKRAARLLRTGNWRKNDGLDGEEQRIQAIREAAETIDIGPEMLKRVPEAVELVDAYRRSWIANGLPEDHNLNEALGCLVAVASRAARVAGG